MFSFHFTHILSFKLIVTFDIWVLSQMFFSSLFFFLQQMQLICHTSSSSVTINTILVCFSWPKVCTHKIVFVNSKLRKLWKIIDITYAFSKNVHTIVSITVYTPALWEEMHSHNYWFVKYRITLGIFQMQTPKMTSGQLSGDWTSPWCFWSDRPWGINTGCFLRDPDRRESQWDR